MDPKQTPGMVATSLVSITAGGSLGPEAPLVQINGSLGSWIAEKLNLSLKHTRVMTFCGMGAALAAFFGDPIGGPMFALEIPHRRGLEYYEAIIPAMVAGSAGGRVRTGFHMAGNADPISRLGLTLQQAMGLQVDRWGVLNMETSRTITELLA